MSRKRQILNWLHRRRWLYRERLLGGESIGIWRVGPFCFKRWGTNITHADIRARCRASRAHADFAPTWKIPGLRWTVRRWITGHFAQHDQAERLQRRHRWASDVYKVDNVLVDATGRALIIDFGLAPPLDAT